MPTPVHAKKNITSVYEYFVNLIGGILYAGLVTLGIIGSFGTFLVAVSWLFKFAFIFHPWVFIGWEICLALFGVCLSGVYLLSLDNRVWMLLTGYARKSITKYIILGFLAMIAVWVPLFLALSNGSFGWLMFLSPVVSSLLFYYGTEDLEYSNP